MEVNVLMSDGLDPEVLVRYWNAQERLSKIATAAIRQEAPVTFGSFKTMVLIPVVVGLGANILYDEIKHACDDLRVSVCVQKVVSEQTGELVHLLLTPDTPKQEPLPQNEEAIPVSASTLHRKKEEDEESEAEN